MHSPKTPGIRTPLGYAVWGLGVWGLGVYVLAAPATGTEHMEAALNASECSS